MELENLLSNNCRRYYYIGLNSTHYLIRKPSINTEQADSGQEWGGEDGELLLGGHRLLIWVMKTFATG